MELPSYLQLFGSKAVSDARVGAIVEESVPLHPGWRREGGSDSLDELHSSVPVVDETAQWYRKWASFAGIGFMVSVGYMDPGNWSTNLVGGAKYGYILLSVILLSSLVAMFLQTLSLRLGVATDRDLVSL